MTTLLAMALLILIGCAGNLPSDGKELSDSSRSSEANTGKAGSSPTLLRYLAELNAVRGEASCTEGVRAYESCEEFLQLHDGCYEGDSTWSMKAFSSAASKCSLFELLSSAKADAPHHFNTDNPDWWKELPASVIGMKGGIYSISGWEEMVADREARFSERNLDELVLTNIVANGTEIQASLSEQEWECGKINDVFHLKAVVTADVDKDGIGELVVEGWRAYESEHCWLGTGNTMSAQFWSVLQKKSADGDVEQLISEN